MSPTVDQLRNEIRLAVGRYERVESTAFTKEALAAICDALDHEIDEGRLPPKSHMRASILRTVGLVGKDDEEDDSERAERPFRKAELEAIATALDTE